MSLDKLYILCIVHIFNMAKTYNNTEKKNNNRQSIGTMPQDMLAKHKLKDNTVSDRVVSRNSKLVKKFVESMKHYRQYVHNVHVSRLPSCLTNSAHYFTIPMSRSDSDNPRDKRAVEAIAQSASGVADQSK